MSVKKGRKREKKNIQVGVAHIQATFNNTIVTVADISGNVIVWASAGGQGFKGSRKSVTLAGAGRLSFIRPPNANLAASRRRGRRGAWPSHPCS